MDWNNDGRIDLVTGEADGRVRVYLNVNTAREPSFNGFFYVQLGGSDFVCSGNSRPWVVDWNQDGRKDLLCGESAGGLHLLLNTGSDAAPSFSSARLVECAGQPLNVGWWSSPTMADCNLDQRQDLIVGSGDGRVYYYENVGTDVNPVFRRCEEVCAAGVPIGVGADACPDVVDWDNDGWLDLVCGLGSWGDPPGNVRLFPALRGLGLAGHREADTDGDGYLAPGESFTVVCTVVNRDTAPAGGVTLDLAASGAPLTVTQGHAPLGTLPAGAMADNAAAPFTVMVSPTAGLGQTVELELTLTANQGAIRKVFPLALRLAEPRLSIEYLADDGSGDADFGPDRGERVRFLVRLTNSGYPLSNAVGRLSQEFYDDGYYGSRLSFLRDTCEFGTVATGATGENFTAPFCFEVSDTPVLPYGYALNLSLTGAQGFATNLMVFVPAGDYCNYGYPDWTWDDTSGGTVLSLGDEGSQAVNLGFEFPFYDLRTNTVHVHANGYLTFGPPDLPRENTPLPDGQPSQGVIAPFWDDLVPAAGSWVRWQRYGSGVDGMWVVEWNNLSPAADPATRVSFQVTLYPYGYIFFRYRNLTGPLALGAGATIGIESPDGRRGGQFSCNQSALQNPYFLYWIPPFVGGDGDRDLLADDYERFWFGDLGCSGLEDLDADGLCNCDELRAGTHPLDPASRLRVTGIRAEPGGQLTLDWQGAPFGIYRLWSAPRLGEAEWTPLGPTLIKDAGAGAGSFSFPGPASALFLQLGTP